MRGNIPQFDLLAPKTLDEVLTRLQSEPGVWRPFAGGTDLMVVLEAGHLKHTRYLSLWGIPGLSEIQVTDREVRIGALATYTDVLEHPVLAKEFPNLGAAARETGAIAIQNRGTVGGNIANASPAADTPPSLLIYEASLELLSKSGTRVVPYLEFHTGYKTTVMRADEIIRSVILPRTTQGLTHYYRKVGTRKAQAISKVCFSGVIQKKGDQILDLRMGLGSVAATPVRAQKTEAFLRGKRLESQLVSGAQAFLAQEITPIDDIRSNREYRLQVAKNLLAEFLGA
jgi:CO/xanthine dehydrogenase FAD-binding subunit